MTQADQTPFRGKHIHYAWTVAALGFLALMVAGGLRSAPTVMIVPLEQKFGWSREGLSFAIALQLFLYGLTGPFSGGFIDRFGIRRVMACGLALTATGFGLTLFVTAAWQLQLVWGVAMGIGSGMVANVMATMIANRWFMARRGLVLGILMGSTAAGQLMFLPSLAALVTDFSLQAALISASLVGFAVMPLILFFMRDYPDQIGQRPYGLPADAPQPPRPPRANPFVATVAALGRAVNSRDFWLLSIGYMMCGASTNGLIGTHFISACIDHGIIPTVAAGMLATMGLINMFGTVASGWLTDRYDSRKLLFCFYFLRALTLFFLPYALDLSFWSLAVFGVFYGLDWYATTAPTFRLTADVFGSNSAGMIFGWVTVMHQVGSSLAAFGAGYLRVASGSYESAFLISGAMCLLGALAVLRIGGKRHDAAGAQPVLAGT